MEREPDPAHDRRRVPALPAVLACAAGAGAGGGVAAVAATPGLVALVLVLIVLVAAIPVAGCTIMLMGMARRGVQTAQSVADVRELMEFGTAAFTATLATLLRPVPSPPVRAAPPARAELVRNGTRRRGPALELVPHHTFWGALTPAERGHLEDLMESKDYDQGTVLWRKDQPADEVIVIRSGLARVSTGVAGDDREIVRRGPGDIVGERAMLLVQERSATVTALTPLRAMTSPATVFNAFLNENPRVVAVLERQIYDRLTRSTRPPGPAPPGAPPGVPPGVPPLTGQHCSVFFVDVAGFSGPHRNDKDRQEIRRVLYEILAGAFERSSVSWSACHREDRGDGALIVVPAGVPAALIVDPLIGNLAAALARHNRDAREPVIA
jgi:hypothetical protein